MAGLYLGGFFAFLDRELLDLRFRLLERQATDDLVVVAIDPSSLRELDVWPWPRGYHAKLIERLLDAGARRIAFDVDFSSSSLPEMDGRFEQALAAAGGRVVLPVFQQLIREPDGARLVLTEPLPRFRSHVALASINVRSDADGLVRRITRQEQWSGARVPTMAALLAGAGGRDAGAFTIDFSIDPATIPRVSFADVLAGRFDPELLRGRQVLIGATAAELQDVMPVPVYKSLAGVLLHAMAYHSLAQGRALQHLAEFWTLILYGILALALATLFARLSWRAGLAVGVASSAGTFALSLAAQAVAPLVVDVAAGIVLISLLYLIGLISRVDRQAIKLLVQGVKLRRANAIMHDIVEHSFDGILTFGDDGRIATANGAAHRIFALADGGLSGRHLETLVPSLPANLAETAAASNRSRPHEVTAIRSDGSPFPMELALSVTRIGDDELRVAIVRDITERKAQQALLEHQALHDALTGLPNRTLLHDRLEHAIRSAKRTQQSLALLLLDLDRFKTINDTLGHPVGDRLLRDVASRLAAQLRESDTIARIGGDEFAVLLPAGGGLQRAERVSRRLLASLEQPFEIDGLMLEVGLSVGIALYPDHAKEPAALLQSADIAMYMAKQEQSGLAVYDNEKDRNSVRHLTLTGELRQAIEQDQLTLHFQPKIDLASGRIWGAEALARWMHPVHGFIPPDEFIPHAEQTGLIRPLTLWVLHTALRRFVEWRETGHAIGIAINLSARNLLDRELPGVLARLIQEAGIEPELLTLEITESAIMQDPDCALAVLRGFEALGVRLSIDDFGTGYSSLAYLSRLPLHELKIDRTFVMNMTENESDALIVRSTIELAHSLGLKVVAEGIESEQHLQILRALGCDAGQGYGISRPLDSADFTAWLQRGPGATADDALPVVQPAAVRL
ncbi:MAG: EAL domain-containing protein [Kiloniellales bacterium]